MHTQSQSSASAIATILCNVCSHSWKMHQLSLTRVSFTYKLALTSMVCKVGAWPVITGLTQHEGFPTKYLSQPTSAHFVCLFVGCEYAS